MVRGWPANCGSASNSAGGGIDAVGVKITQRRAVFRRRGFQRVIGGFLNLLVDFMREQFDAVTVENAFRDSHSG